MTVSIKPANCCNIQFSFVLNVISTRLISAIKHYLHIHFGVEKTLDIHLETCRMLFFPFLTLGFRGGLRIASKSLTSYLGRLLLNTPRSPWEGERGAFFIRCYNCSEQLHKSLYLLTLWLQVLSHFLSCSLLVQVYVNEAPPPTPTLFSLTLISTVLPCSIFGSRAAFDGYRNL